MAKRRKKGRHGRHRKRRMSAKQRRAAMRNLKKARRALRGRRRRGGKRRKNRGRNKSRRRSSGRRRSHSQSRLSNKAHQVYQTLINRGRTPQQAHKVAARIDRMRTGKVKRYFENQAVQAKSAQQLSNLFAGFGAAGHLAKQAG